MDIREELAQARYEYQLAVQQENNAEGEFIDLAIMNTNAASIKLENVIKKAKLMGYITDKIAIAR